MLSPSDVPKREQFSERLQINRHAEKIDRELHRTAGPVQARVRDPARKVVEHAAPVPRRQPRRRRVRRAFPRARSGSSRGPGSRSGVRRGRRPAAPTHGGSPAAGCSSRRRACRQRSQRGIHTAPVNTRRTPLSSVMIDSTTSANSATARGLPTARTRLPCAAIALEFWSHAITSQPRSPSRCAIAEPMRPRPTRLSRRSSRHRSPVCCTSG